MSQKPTTVLLRNIDNKKTEPFEAGHADRLLAYPNTRWEKVAEAEDSPKSKKTPPTGDATGQPTAV